MSDVDLCCDKNKYNQPAAAINILPHPMHIVNATSNGIGTNANECGIAASHCLLQDAVAALLYIAAKNQKH